MRSLRSGIIICCGAILAGCSHMAGSSPLPGGVQSAGFTEQQQAGSHGYQLLYKWVGGNNGGGPFAGLTNVGGTLYGTTYAAWSGTYRGTIFKITTSGDETVLYRFTGGKDGEKPFAGLTYLSGLLYGTTQQGGQHNCGIVFTITPSGSEKQLYSFKCEPKDGGYPRSNLTNVSGTLYGTTYLGGPSDLGTVFAITPSGSEKVIHGFHAGNDGARPFGTPLNVGGTLYGTTSAGGKSDDGAVYKIDTSLKESAIYDFKGGADGSVPMGGLVAIKSMLYGTTRNGGTYGKGTIFRVTTAGVEKVIYSFKGGNDGAAPDAGLIVHEGALYGTTVFGDSSNSGIVFKMTTTGTESVLYDFTGGLYGFGPVAGLTYVSGKLYGDTTWGGEQQDQYSCCGTVFSLSP